MNRKTNHMQDQQNRQTVDQPAASFSEKLQQRARRKLKARGKRNDTTWSGLGMFGLVGWSVAVPSLIGIASGIWLDQRWPGDASWTLTFLILGIVLGCINAWYWIKKEGDRDD